METFVVRIFDVDDDEPRGQVEHIGSGTRVTFRSLTELNTFLQRREPSLIDRDNPS